jgi:hypothetical protein
MAVNIRPFLGRDVDGTRVCPDAVPPVHACAVLPTVPRTRVAEGGATKGRLGGTHALVVFAVMQRDILYDTEPHAEKDQRGSVQIISEVSANREHATRRCISTSCRGRDYPAGACADDQQNHLPSTASCGFGFELTIYYLTRG